LPAPPKSRPPPAPARKPARPPFEIDRIILLRAAFVVVVVLFLYMILRVSMIAFGGSAKREATRIERAIDTSTVHAPVPAAAPAAAPKSAGAPSP
jgi:hypothetical protein